jgi:hypothetical protein
MKPTILVRTEFFERETGQATREAMIRPLMQCGFLVEGDAKRSMIKGGRIPGKKRGIPSTPPNPPHAQLGNLKGSITTAPTERQTVIVGPTRIAWYGKIHEKGGRYGGRNYPRRAFMLPALYRMAPRFPAKFRSMNLAATPAGRRLNARKGKKPS